jgi:hypothetical protein
VIIGLSGYARSGKDEAAKVLVEEFGFERIAFADKLRDFLYALNPIVEYERGFSGGQPTRTKDGMLWSPTRLRDVIDVHSWDGYKETIYGTEIRGLLQRLGTEAGRGILGDNVWIDAALGGVKPDGRYVVTDVRFPNEADAVRSRDGRIWRVSRSGVGPANSHASETSLDDYDFDARVSNDGTLEEYHDKIVGFFKQVTN